MGRKRKHQMLVAGASGVVGHAAVEHFAALPDWEVIALSRRPVALPEGVRHVAVDLMDPGACARAARELTGVTHVLYAALFELPELVAGWRDARQMSTNEAMLRHLLDALEPQARAFMSPSPTRIHRVLNRAPFERIRTTYLAHDSSGFATIEHTTNDCPRAFRLDRIEML